MSNMRVGNNDCLESLAEKVKSFLGEDIDAPLAVRFVNLSLYSLSLCCGNERFEIPSRYIAHGERGVIFTVTKQTLYAMLYRAVQMARMLNIAEILEAETAEQPAPAEEADEQPAKAEAFAVTEKTETAAPAASRRRGRKPRAKPN